MRMILRLLLGLILISPVPSLADTVQTVQMPADTMPGAPLFHGSHTIEGVVIEVSPSGCFRLGGGIVVYAPAAALPQQPLKKGQIVEVTAKSFAGNVYHLTIEARRVTVLGDTGDGDLIHPHAADGFC